MKLQEQMGFFRVIHVRVVNIHTLHLQFIQQLDTCHGYADLNGHDNGINSLFNRFECTGRSRDRVGLSKQTHGEFCNDTQRSLRPHE